MVFCGKKNENLLKKKNGNIWIVGKKIYLWKIKQKLIELWKKKRICGEKKGIVEK